MDKYDRKDNEEEDEDDEDLCMKLLEEDKWKKNQADCIRKCLAYAYKHGLIEDDPNEFTSAERINTIKHLLTLKEGELDIDVCQNIS